LDYRLDQLTAARTITAAPEEPDESRWCVDVKDLLNRVTENISVSRAFGSAYEKEGVLVIPVALVAGGGGGGEGSSTTANSSHDDETAVSSNDLHGAVGKGSGGGFGGVVVPVGAYVVKDEQVRWVPAVNVTVIVIAVLCAIRLLTKSRLNVQRVKHR
jgi:uncharacterized spore protein YtfJ